MNIKEENRPHIVKLLALLNSRSCELGFYKAYADQLQSEGIVNDVVTINGKEELKSFKPDLALTLGGDGTILNAVTIIQDLQTPILGINLGRLGFLASMEDYKVEETIDKYFNGQYSIQERTMLQLNAEPGIFHEYNFALNDCTIVKRDTSSMITIHTYIDGAFLNSYWADGLIISTPTGSTGYSLSGGGPIIFPNSGNFLITPVAPHNLTARPIVFSDDSVISLKIEGRSENFLCTLDARYETITAEHEITIKKCPFKTKLIRLEGTNFMETIRNKLAWGRDSRN